MLEGTELYDAYAPLIGSAEAAAFNDFQQEEPKKKSLQQVVNPTYNSNIIYDELNNIQKATNKHYGYGQQQQQTSKPIPRAQPVQQPTVVQQPQVQQQPQMDISLFNKQFEKQIEQEQKIAMLMNEVKKQKTAPQQSYQSSYVSDESYWDKMTNKKKDVGKYVQSSLIILFAISLHYLIDFLLKAYLEHNNVSFNREIIIRVLYPIGIVFIAWNIIAFNK